MEYMFVLFEWGGWVRAGVAVGVWLTVLWYRLQGGAGLHHVSDNTAESGR